VKAHPPAASPMPESALDGPLEDTRRLWGRRGVPRSASPRHAVSGSSATRRPCLRGHPLLTRSRGNVLTRGTALRPSVERDRAHRGDRPGRRALPRVVRGVGDEPARRPAGRSTPAGERPRRPGTPPPRAGRLAGRHPPGRRSRATPWSAPCGCCSRCGTTRPSSTSTWRCTPGTAVRASAAPSSRRAREWPRPPGARR